MFCAVFSGQAQEKVWVFFTDKGTNVEESLAHPEKLLSSEALARRAEKGLSVDIHDVPVHGDYLDILNEFELEVLSTSRWLNAAAVSVKAECIDELNKLCFVNGLQPIQTLIESHEEEEIEYPLYVETAYAQALTADDDMPFEYGEAELQNTMINVHSLHKKGYTGKGVRMAIFDSGFDAVDTIAAFDSLWANNQIIHWYDFVDKDTTLFREDAHGTQVLSTIGANIPGEMIGTAPHATFILCRTEDSGSETHQEEHNWVAAMEWVDSVGVDVIHSSLGYSEFDEGEGDYTYEEMDGNTAVITKAADRAAAKGILVTTSAGNQGDETWKYITAPCDGDSVLCVGAVTKSLKRARFSSFGPASDGRIKPDVVALGQNSTVASPSNYVTNRNGTSFSGPIIAGMVACVRQAHPKRSNMDIIKAIQLSCDQYALPDDEYGYGIPDAGMADSLLANVKDLSTVKIEMEAKPIRGKQPAKKKEIVFTDSPKSAVNVSGTTLTVSTKESGATILNVQLMRGTQKVFLRNQDYFISDDEASFDIGILLDGDHYVNIKTTDYEENVKFSR